MGKPINQSELTDILVRGLTPQEPEQEAAEQAATEQAETEDTSAVESLYEDESTEDTEEVVSESTEEQAADETSAATEEETEEVEISDLNQLAQAIEVEPDWLYNIKIPMSDGRDPVSLSELKDQAQEYARTNELRAQLEAERAELNTQRESKEKEISESLSQFAQMPQELMQAQAEAQALAYQYQNYDWDTLEKENPGQAALTKQNIATQYQLSLNKVEEVKGKIGNAIAENAKKVADSEKGKILTFIPDWKDDEVRVRDQSDIRKMMNSYNYSDDEVNSIVDHRAMRIAYDMLKMQRAMNKTKKTVKKLQKVPKVLKPGATPPARSQSDIQRDIVKQGAKAKTKEGKVRSISQLLVNASKSSRRQ